MGDGVAVEMKSKDRGEGKGRGRWSGVPRILWQGSVTLTSLCLHYTLSTHSHIHSKNRNLASLV